MLHERIESLYQNGATVEWEGNAVELDRSAMPREDVELLYQLATTSPVVGDSLEVGMAFGLSSLALCQARQELGQGRHIAIDPYQKSYFQNAGICNLEETGLMDQCDFIEERSYLALPKLCQEGRQLSLAFIDGNHRFEHTFLDFFYIDRMLQPGGFVMFHDTWMQGIRKVLSLILNNHSASYEIAREYMSPALNWKGKLIQAREQRKVYKNDTNVNSTLQGEICPQYMVLKKIAHLSDQDYDNAWEAYTPF